MITRKMVKNGYERGFVELILSPHHDGVVCRIGDYFWFYFGGLTAEEFMNVEEYKKVVPKKDILNEIYETLKDFLHDPGLIDEYRYYESFLRERGCDK